jgi:hypothetical protein
VPVDFSPNELPLGNLFDTPQLLGGRCAVSTTLVLNRFAFQQTRIFAAFQVAVRLFANFDMLARQDVRTLEQAACVSIPTWPAIRPWTFASGRS